MKFSSTLGVMVLAGALGAVAGGAVSVLGHAGGDDGANAEILAHLDDLRGEVEDLRDSVRESRKGVGDLDGRLVSAEMDLERMLDEAKKAADAAAAAPSAPGTLTLPSGSPGIPVMRRPLPIRLSGDDLSADVSKAAQEAARAMQERFARSMELRRLPEDERWRKAEEDLGLTTAQTNEIKAAKEAFDTAMKAATSSATSTTTDGAAMTFRTVDGNKMRAARKQLDERVNGVLNNDQKERWKSEGWKGALTGAGGPGAFTSRIRRSTSGSGDEPVRSTGIITIDVETDSEK